MICNLYLTLNFDFLEKNYNLTLQKIQTKSTKNLSCNESIKTKISKLKIYKVETSILIFIVQYYYSREILVINF